MRSFQILLQIPCSVYDHLAFLTQPQDIKGNKNSHVFVWTLRTPFGMVVFSRHLLSTYFVLVLELSAAYTLPCLIKIFSWPLSLIMAVNEELVFEDPAGDCCDYQLAAKVTWPLHWTGKEVFCLTSKQVKVQLPSPHLMPLTLLTQQGQCRQHLPAQVLQGRDDGVQHLQSPVSSCWVRSRSLFFLLYMEFVQKWFFPPSSPLALELRMILKSKNYRTLQIFFLTFFLAVPPLPALALP